MIRYNLRCDGNHAFESWFQSSGSYDSQVRRKLVSCPQCGSTKVEKAIMAPQIGRKGNRKQDVGPTQADNAALVMAPQEAELRAKLKELRDHIVKNADNVGESFPTEARAMHYGDKEHRPIYGAASLEEARALIDEGIEVAPIPLLPDDRN